MTVRADFLLDASRYLTFMHLIFAPSLRPGGLGIFSRFSCVTLFLFFAAGQAQCSSSSAGWWPQFRGPNGLGIAPESNPPIQFGPDNNVLWKVEVPPGHSSPCIAGSRIFLTGVRDGHLETLCLDRATGRTLWQKSAPPEKLEPAHRLGSPAASTPTTDGRLVFVYFGSFGVLAYDLEGREQWKHPLPPPMVEFGTGTSPVLANDRVILVLDQDQGSFMIALEKETGKQIWRVERPEFRRSFSTPLVWHHSKGDELVVPGSIWLRSYDLKDGHERWSYSGTSRVANSSPAAEDDLLFSASWNVGADPGDRVTLEPYDVYLRMHDANKDGKLSREEIPAGTVRERFNQLDLNKDGFATETEWKVMAEMFEKAGNALVAIRPGGQGDITKSHVVWKSTRSLPYVCSPVCYQGRVYTVKSGGLASCYDAKTGRVHYQDERIGAAGDYYASLISAANRIYAASQNGQVVVWKAGDTLDILATNNLKEEIMATPAAIDTTFYVRTIKTLYAFGK